MFKMLLKYVPLNRLYDLTISNSQIQHFLQIYLSIIKQAYLQIAISCHSQPVAAPAEVLRHGCNEPYLTFVSGDKISFWRLRFVNQQIVSFLQLYPQPIFYYFPLFKERYELFVIPLVFVERHELDQPQFYRPVLDKLYEIQQLVIIKIPNSHDINFHSFQ